MITGRMLGVVVGLTLVPLACAHGDRRGGGTAGATAQEQGETSSEARQAETRSGEAAAQPGETAAGERATQTVVGTVEKAEGDTLTVRSSKLSDPYELTLRDDTAVTHEGQTISRDEIAEGDQVRATFAGTGNSGAASEIVVIRKGGGKATQGTERTTAGEAEEQQAPPSTPSRSQ
jgi:hypothetical protein